MSLGTVVECRELYSVEYKVELMERKGKTRQAPSKRGALELYPVPTTKLAPTMFCDDSLFDVFTI